MKQPMGSEWVGVRRWRDRRRVGPILWPGGGAIALLLWSGILALLLWGLWGSTVDRAVAQSSQQSTFRISRLESEVRTLRSQLRRLESQLERVERSTDASPSSQSGSPAAPSRRDDGASPYFADSTGTPGADLMFDQLATLVIETRQDMFALQEQVAALEEQLAAP